MLCNIYLLLESSCSAGEGGEGEGKLTEGTGLGEGDTKGAKDISDQLEDQDQLLGAQQKERQQQQEEEQGQQEEAGGEKQKEEKGAGGRWHGGVCGCVERGPSVRGGWCLGRDTRPVLGLCQGAAGAGKCHRGGAGSGWLLLTSVACTCTLKGDE